eukprot:1159119-Pelagomonas_calceolata.AAC.4
MHLHADKGPFLMLMECHARSGCLVSSNLPVHELKGSDSTLADQCVRVPYLDSHRVPMVSACKRAWAIQVYTEDPLEGVSVLYDPSSSDDQVLPRFGVTTVSEIQDMSLFGPRQLCGMVPCLLACHPNMSP